MSTAADRVQGEPWEKRKDESAKAYQAFSIYRDLGAKRSIRHVAEQLSKNAVLIARWSSKYKWVERVDAWDRMLAEQQRLAKIAQIEAMEKRHARLGEGMQTLAARKLQRELERTDPAKVGKAEAEAALDAIELHDMRALVKDGTGLERVALGEPETITEDRQTHTWADAVVQRRRERAEKEEAERLAKQGAVSEPAEDDESAAGVDD